MKKNTLFLLMCFSLTLSTFSAFSADGLSKSSQLSVNNNIPAKKPSRADIFRTHGAAEDYALLWADDFEGSQPVWQSNPNYMYNTTEYQPTCSWQLVESNFASPTHSWHATETYSSWAEFLISPIITLPEQVEIDGFVSPLQNVLISFNYDLDTPQIYPDDPFVFGYLLFRVERYWLVGGEHVAAGDSAYHLDMLAGSTESHGRQWLITPQIDLSAATGQVNLTFSHDYATEEAYDYLVLQVSTDGFDTYTYINHWGDVGASNGFVDESFDLSAFIGMTIQIRFEANTDPLARVGFWAIDEIKVADNSGVLFYDGAEGDPLMDNDGFVSIVLGYPGLVGRTPNPTPNWSSRRFTVPVFKQVFFPGDDIRIGILWSSDGDAIMGRGLFVDDIQLLGEGASPKDLAISGLSGLNTIALHKAFAPTLKVTNTGIEPVSGNVAWQGTIKDGTGNPLAVLVGMPKRITDFPVGESLELPLLAGREWTPTVPGTYELSVQLNFADGDPENNTATVGLLVPGGQFATPLYHTNFAPYLGESSLEDFGWTVVNDGGNAILNSNVNQWEYGGIVNQFGEDGPFIGAILSYGWGDLEVGPDQDAVMDSSEVLEEYLISPPIDVTDLNAQNTLAVRYYTYYRPGYPGYSPPFGCQKNAFTVDWSVDGGQSWVNAFEFAQDDSADSGNLDRLPHMAYSGDPLVTNTLAYMNTDLTPALHAAKASGSNTVWIRFGVKSEDSYIMGASVEDVMVYAGTNAPAITELVDVPQDNGRQLQLTFAGSANDLVYEWPNWADMTDVGDLVAFPVTHYDIWRVNEPTAGSSYAGVYADMKTLAKAVKQPVTGEFYFLEGDALAVDFVATIPAAGFPSMGFSYGTVIPTLANDQQTGVFINACTTDPEIVAVSELVVAMAKDNLAPDAPAGLAITTQGNSIILSWEAACTPVDDVDFYSIYRREQSDDFGTALATTQNLTYTDDGVEVGKVYCYVVTATDMAGNESDRSGEGNVVTSVAMDKPGVPSEFALEQNYPNPFNPTTAVEYALPQAGEVTVSIYNTQGQLIQTIQTGYQEAGYHKVMWDAGAATAGLYFLQLKAAGFSKMIKMMLLK
ncbi:MAG TPA: immune inhibitor A [bacterium]|nr:immune inhibitor A [bacterium]